MLGGFLDATDFVDVYGLASPWMHFMNLAFSTGSAAIDLPNDAALGAAVNWGEVNELPFGSGLDDQYTLEFFYRWQLTPGFALTGDYQYLQNPALNPNDDSIHVLAVRGRFAL